MMKLNHPRVWRTYQSGGVLDGWSRGKAVSPGPEFPEEWIGSVVEARNPVPKAGEGLSVVEGDGRTLKEILETDPKRYLGKKRDSMGVLVKLIDAGERLTIQVHPDREKAERLFHSSYGKTECWYFLDGGVGKDPCVYYGFRTGITRELWEELFEEQDLKGMLACLHRFSVRPGDVVLVRGGTPHAIGEGCFLAEIQEPTDLTVRTERTTPSGQKVLDHVCHQGIGFKRMFDCFDYRGTTEEVARRECFLRRSLIRIEKDGHEERLVDHSQTPCFGAKRLTVHGGGRWEIKKEDDFCLLLALSGNGRVRWSGGQMGYVRGESFFVPAEDRELWIEAETETEFLWVEGPRIEETEEV
ncbi:MAG TPA: mannose-6-phosphate isomerase [Candidatus Enterocloster excrementipullorum]|uniref:Mannose-6-phosphate isomerase n=1 Tax=Candidatus Enterocloster excrementipullorum TaxID=2838559 RepID=A0A9D2SGX7_9FIRM|nr:mannose-6-phosphate isomerase [Candidatus Enterocloster excrementipullorum]